MTARLGVLERGSGSAVVMVHGVGGSAATSFAATIPALARHHHVLAVDLPGSGPGPLPPPPPGGWTPDAVADALAAAVRSRIDGPALLIGHSLGASVVARAAVRHRELASGLVLVAASLRRDPRTWLATRLWRRLFEVDRTALGQYLVMSTASPSWLAQLSEQDLTDLAHLAAELVPDGTGLQLDVAEHSDLAGDLALLDVPVTAVLGDEDPLVSTDPWWDATTPRGLDTVVWPGGHDVLAHHPHELVALVGRLTARPAAAPTVRIHTPRSHP